MALSHIKNSWGSNTMLKWLEAINSCGDALRHSSLCRNPQRLGSTTTWIRSDRDSISLEIIVHHSWAELLRSRTKNLHRKKPNVHLKEVIYFSNRGEMVDEGPAPGMWTLMDCHCSSCSLDNTQFSWEGEVFMGGRSFQYYIYRTTITQILEIKFLMVQLNQLIENLRNIKM